MPWCHELQLRAIVTRDAMMRGFSRKMAQQIWEERPVERLVSPITMPMMEHGFLAEASTLHKLHTAN